jgi:hypothetical protein
MFGFLLAAQDWVTALIPIVLAIICLISHVMSAVKAAPGRNKPMRRPLEPVERPLRPAQKAPVPPAAGQSPLNAEIEQFLKRAGDRRGQRSRGEAEPAAPSKGPQRAPAKTAARKQPPAAPSERRDFDAVTASVEKHLANRGFKQRAEHLADDIVRADQEMEQRLQKSFSHRVGTLGDATASAVNAPVTDAQPVPEIPTASAAQNIASLLANPQNIKQAIILNEILARPDHRW